MPGHAQFVRLLIAVTTAVASLTVLAAPVAADETSTFTGQKNCTAVPPPALGGYCLITTSSLEILVGAKVYYTDAHVVAGVLSSPVTLRATDEDRSTATGQCTYFRAAVYPPGHGFCTYTSVTGELPGFRASVAVSAPLSPGVFGLSGNYWFERDAKTFTGVKNCNNTPSPPDPGGFCVFTQANLKLLRNARVYYTNPDAVALAAGILSSPVTLTATDEQGSTA